MMFSCHLKPFLLSIDVVLLRNYLLHINRIQAPQCSIVGADCLTFIHSCRDFRGSTFSILKSGAGVCSSLLHKSFQASAAVFGSYR